MFKLSYNLYDLKNYPNWCVYRLFNNNSNKLSKLPFNPITHLLIKTNDSSTWSTYDNCIKTLNEHSYDGIGFIFSTNDPYIGIDIDNINNKELVKELITLLDSYTEYSPSRKGLHIICKYNKVNNLIGRKNNSLELEIYNYNRFFTITSDVYLDTIIKNKTEEIDRIIEKYFDSNMKKILNEFLEKK